MDGTSIRMLSRLPTTRDEAGEHFTFSTATVNETETLDLGRKFACCL